MKFKLICAVLICCFSVVVRAEIVFHETFNGYKEGSKAKDNITNPDDVPVLWSDEAYTSIKRMDSLKSNAGLGSIAEIKNPKISSSSIARSGTESSALLFTYRAGPNSWSEQRFKINPQLLSKQGIKGLQEVWIQYDMFIPSNYKIIDDNPTSTNYFGAGHKVFTLYADAYSAPNATLILGGVIARRAPDGKTEYDNHVYQMSTLSTYKDSERIFTQVGIDEKNREIKWVDAKKDLGTWQRRTMHFKFPSDAAANDGVIEFWIRRADGTIMKIIDVVSGSFYGYTQNYFNAGYINGFYNAGFPEETFLVVDNFILSSKRDAVDLTAISETIRPAGPSDTKLQ